MSSSQGDPHLTATAAGVLLPVKVIPRAKRNAVDGLLAGALKLRLASPPVDGKANAECLAFLASIFGLKRDKVELIRGATGRQKIFLLKGVSVEQARQRIAALLAPESSEART